MPDKKKILDELENLKDEHYKLAMRLVSEDIEDEDAPLDKK